MAYTLPSAADLKARFPELNSVDNTLLGFWIEAAALFVDRTWIERDYAPAIIFLAAHLWRLNHLATIQSGGTTASGAETFVNSVSFGDRRISYGLVNKGGQIDRTKIIEQLAATPYGQLFEMLRARNAPYVLII